ncbi:MAG: hypothetical protein WCK49_06975 [Myxococcaceae bacterium]
MKFTIVFTCLFSVISIAGDSGVMFGRHTSAFAIATLISVSTQKAKNILDLIFPTAEEEKISTHELIKKVVNVRGFTTKTDQVSQLEAELAARSEQDPRMHAAEANTDTEEESVYVKAAKQSISVPGMRMATKDAPAAKSAPSPESSDQDISSPKEATGVSDELPSSNSEDDFLVVARRSIEQSPSKLRKKRNPHFSESDDDDFLVQRFGKQRSTRFCDSDGDDDSEIPAFVQAVAETPSAPHTNFITPCGTPVGPAALPARTRAQRALRNLPAIWKNMLMMKRRGISGKLLETAYWAEACASNHPFVGDDTGARKLREWKESSKIVSFEEVSFNLPSVTYLTPEQRDTHRVRIERHPGQNARLIQNGTPLTGYDLIFVMGPSGGIYVGKDMMGQFHHSSFFAGAAVLWAGGIGTNAQGEINFLSDESGHYKPGLEQTLNGLAELERQGVDLSKVRFEETVTDRQYNAKEYLDSHRPAR